MARASMLPSSRTVSFSPLSPSLRDAPVAPNLSFNPTPSLSSPPKASLSERLRRRGSDHADSSHANLHLMVFREHHPLNKGKRSIHCTGLRGKLYDRTDILQPIIDSMQIMHYKLGWSVSHPIHSSLSSHMEVATSCTVSRGASSSAWQCTGCSNKDPNNFLPTADKSHMSCKICGVVSSAIHISTDREKNCAREDDKTTHADRPYDSNTDRFDRPAKSCDEMRKEREQQVLSSRISKQTKQKNGLGWAHEHSVRQAARAERERMEMDPKDSTKGNHIQQQLDKLFEPLEPMNNQIKRFCRMEADRAWREAVRHSNICCARGTCQLRIKEKSHIVIADAVFANSLARLLDGHTTLDGVTHSGLLVLADKRMALQSSKGASSSHRAVQTIVATFLANDQSTPLPECQPIQMKSESPVTISPKKASQHGTPFSRSDSSGSDVAGVGEAIQLRNHLSKMHKTIGPSVPSMVLDGALKALQSHEFRAALMTDPKPEIKPLTQSGVAFVILEAVSRKMFSTGYLQSMPPKMVSELAVPGASIQEAVSVTMDLLPAHAVEQDDATDYLF